MWIHFLSNGLILIFLILKFFTFNYFPYLTAKYPFLILKLIPLFYYFPNSNLRQKSLVYVKMFFFNYLLLSLFFLIFYGPMSLFSFFWLIITFYYTENSQILIGLEKTSNSKINLAWKIKFLVQISVLSKILLLLDSFSWISKDPWNIIILTSTSLFFIPLIFHAKSL